MPSGEPFDTKLSEALIIHFRRCFLLGRMRLAIALDTAVELPQRHVIDITRRESHYCPGSVVARPSGFAVRERRLVLFAAPASASPGWSSPSHMMNRRRTSAAVTASP